MPQIPPMLGGGAIDPTLKAILDGQQALLNSVNELKSAVVTGEHLSQFHKLQKAEMQTYVAAEKSHLHSTVHSLAEDVTSLRTQVSVLERAGPSASSGAAGQNPNDPNLRRVAFVGFPKTSPEPRRIEAMEIFMKAHFANVRYVADLFPDKSGEPTLNGYVEVSDRKIARRITNKVKESSLKAAGFESVVIKPALTEIDRHRNWAIKEAERMIRESVKLRNGTVKVERGENRGIYVDGLPAFTQKERFSRGGVFHGVFTDLQLP